MVTNMESHSHSCYEDGNGAKKKKKHGHPKQNPKLLYPTGGKA